MTMIDTEHRDHITCPYCGIEQPEKSKCVERMPNLGSGLL